MELTGDGARQLALLGDPRDLDQPDTVLELGRKLFGHFECERGLAHPAGAGEGHQSRFLQGFDQGLSLRAPPHQREVPDRQVPPGGGQCPQWWELVGQAVDAELVDVLVVGQIPEFVSPQILEPGTGGE